MVPSAVSISDDVLSELSTGALEMVVDDESAVDEETDVVDAVVDGEDVDVLLAAVVTTDGATGGGVAATGAAGAGALTGSGGGGTGLVVVGAGAVDVELDEVEEVALDDEDVELEDDEVELVDVDEVLAGAGGATGAGPLTGGVVVLVLLVLVDAVEPDVAVDDFNVSAPVPPLNTTGMVD